MPVCASIAQRSVLMQPCDLRLITTENDNVDVKCAAFELVNMRSGKYWLRLDLLNCEDILLCCSGATDLGFFGLSGCTWLTIQDSRHFSLSLQRCWTVAAEGFKIFVTAQLCNEVWRNVCFENSSNTGLSDWVIRNVLLVCVIEFGCSKRVFVPGSYSVPFFFTNGDEKFGQMKVELIGRYVFNSSRLFQWLTKFLPCV